MSVENNVQINVNLNSDEFNKKLQQIEASLIKSVSTCNTSLMGLNDRIIEMSNKYGASIGVMEAQTTSSTDKISNDFVTLISKTIDIATGSIPSLISNFSSLSEESSSFSGVLQSINTAMLAYRGYNDVIKPIQTAWSLATTAVTEHGEANRLMLLASNGGLSLMQTGVALITGEISLATAATSIWSGAMNLVGGAMNMALIGIGALTAGLIAWLVCTTDSKNKTDENVEATNKLAESHKKLNEEIKSSKEDRVEANKAAEVQVATADVLMNKIEGLSAKENKSNAEKATMKKLVDELNNTLPNLNLLYDEEKDVLSESTDTLRKKISAQKDLVLAQAAQENMLEVAKSLAAVELENIELSKQHKKNEDSLAEAVANTQAAKEARDKADSDNFEKANQHYVDMIEIEDKKEKAFNKSDKLLKENEKSIKNLNKELDNTKGYAESLLDSSELKEKLAGITQMCAEKGVEIPKAISDGILEGNYIVPETVEEMQSLIEFDSLKQRVEEFGIQMPSSLAEAIKSGEIAPSEAVLQMQNLVSFEDLLSKSKIAGETVPSSISEAVLVGALSPQDAIMQMQNLVSFEDLLSKSKISGKAVPDQIRQAVLEGKMTPSEAIKEMNGEIDKSLGEQLPSTKQKGQGNVQAFATGFQDISSVLFSVSTMKKGAEDEMSKSNAFESGENTSKGYSEGIVSKNALISVISSAITMVERALTAIKKRGQEGSPWKTTKKNGEFAAEGLALGIENKSQDAVKSMEVLTQDLIATSNAKITESFLTEQFRINQPMSILANVETMKMQQLNDSSNRILKAALDGDIKVQLNLDGRELAIAQAPLIAEELAFQ